MNNHLCQIKDATAAVEMAGVGVGGISKHPVKVHIAITDKAVDGDHLTGGLLMVGDKVDGIIGALYHIERGAV